MIFDDRDRVRVRNTVLAVASLAWLFLWMRSLWSPGLPHQHMHHPAAGAGAVSVAPAFDWILMFAAMMAPTLIPPIQFVRSNGLARRRARSTWLFVTGYTAVWVLAGVCMMLVVAALGSSRLPQSLPVGAFFLVALIWQCSPAKQACLNRCHKHKPLAAFGRAADVDALVFGADKGVWCVASCWAWMLLPMLLATWHLWAMMAVTILIFCERLESPAPARWQWRGLGRAYRIVSAWVRFRVRASAAEQNA